MQGCSNYIANALELLLSCSKPSRCVNHRHWSNLLQPSNTKPHKYIDPEFGHHCACRWPSIFSLVAPLHVRTLYYCSDLTLSQEFQPMAAQLSMKAALPLAKILVTSCRSSNIRPWPSACKVLCTIFRMFFWPLMVVFNSDHMIPSKWRMSSCEISRHYNIWNIEGSVQNYQLQLKSKLLGESKMKVSLTHWSLKITFDIMACGQHWFR